MLEAQSSEAIAVSEKRQRIKSRFLMLALYIFGRFQRGFDEFFTGLYNLKFQMILDLIDTAHEIFSAYSLIHWQR
jgi:hypothetical protein